MIYILTGVDDFSRTEALEKIKAGIDEPTMLAANTVNLEGFQLSVAEFRAVTGTLPFLASKRLVIVNGLLERFEPKTRGNTRGKTDRAKKTDELAAWVSATTGLPETTDLVLIDGKIGSRNPLLKEISQAAELRNFPPLNRPQLRQWLNARVKEIGGSIAPEAAELLIKLVGSNLWVMSQELDKLLLYTGSRPIGEEEVRLLVGASQELSIFNLVDAIIDLKPAEASRSLRNLLDRGATPAYIMVMLTRQVRLMTRFKELQGRGLKETDIQKTLGLTNDFIFQKTRQQAGRYSRHRLGEVYHRLLEVDVSIKTGRLNGETALNILVAELCREAVNSS